MFYENRMSVGNVEHKWVVSNVIIVGNIRHSEQPHIFYVYKVFLTNKA